jgi:NTE family protein
VATQTSTSIPAVAPAGEPSENLGFAFGGGGVRGWAHLGVLSVTERLGLRPGRVAGTSAGAITASFVAAGFSVEEMKVVMRSQRTRSLFSLRFDRLGLVNTDGFSAYLERHLGGRNIEELDLPLAIVCTDLESGKEVVIDRGPVVPAVLASCALPGIFAPVEIGGRLLMDGGVCNNVPVSALVNRGTEYTVGVQLYKRVGAINPHGDGTLDEVDDELDEKVGLGLWVDRLRQRLGIEGADAQGITHPNGLEVVQRALDIMMAQIEGYRLQAYRPDVLITPRVRTAGMLSFGDEKEAIFQAGVDAAERRIDELNLLASRVNAERRVWTRTKK